MTTRKNHGFTLMEVIIYIGLFALLMGGALVATYQLLEGGGRNQAAVSIQEEGTFIYRKINWALSGATDASINGTSTLIVQRPDLGQASPLVFDVNGTNIRLTRGNNSSTVLNRSSSPVSNVVFTVSNTDNATSVTANFEIESVPFVFQTYLR